MYNPNNATSISIAISKLIIFVSDRNIIVPTRPLNEAAMPATAFSVLFLGIGYVGKAAEAPLASEMILIEVPVCGRLGKRDGLPSKWCHVIRMSMAKEASNAILHLLSSVLLRHRFHARSMYVCIMDQSGKVLVHQNIDTAASGFLALIAPDRGSCRRGRMYVYPGYWLADLCAPACSRFRETMVFLSAHPQTTKTALRTELHREATLEGKSK
jgi:hypothetical protein